MKNNTLLELNNLKIIQNDETIIESISFKLEKNKCLAILGESGSGKSTILYSIAGIINPAQGYITLNQRQIASKNINLAPEKRKISMLFQDIALFPHLNIEQNILFGIESTQSKEEKKQTLNELLNLIELKSKKKSYPHELSLGQQQRVGLARALAVKSELLLLDEPFASQDQDLRTALLIGLKNYLKNHNIACIMVTHDQNEAFTFADNIAILQNKTVEQIDTSYNIYHNPRTKFVADFIGEGVFIDVNYDEHNILKTPVGDFETDDKSPEKYKGKNLELLIRPDDVKINENFDNRYKSMIEAKVVSRVFQGSRYLYSFITTQTKVTLLAYHDSHSEFNINQIVYLTFDLEHFVYFVK